ncbi:MAG: Crp/Fnr family transcriptional regulator [Dehalococcoidia bacterium]|jgi:CRP-like cAMP-binding protein|nr:Crp/Fnr family transcriptional regulator [Dehalococcoidia bacterium]
MDATEVTKVTEQPAGGGDHAQVFRDAPLLANVDEQDVRALAEMGEARQFVAGQSIFTQGDPGDALYTIVQGSVRIVVVSSTGREATLATLARGDSLGELALLDGQPRSASAIATEPTTTLRVARADFRRWLLERPRAGVAMLETLGLRLRRTNDAVTDLSFLELPQRIAKRLLVLAEMAGGAVDGREVRVTQAALASMVGSSREAVKQAPEPLRRGRLGRSPSRRRRHTRRCGPGAAALAPASTRLRADLWRSFATLSHARARPGLRPGRRIVVDSLLRIFAITDGGSSRELRIGHRAGAAREWPPLYDAALEDPDRAPPRGWAPHGR